MKSDYPKIFEPITIKRTTIKNRIAMTPMGTNYGETSGEMSNRHMNYYSLRAKGGVGLIILENANIEYPVGSNGTSQIRIDHDSFMPRYYQLVENLHKNGATVAIQINHAGASASSARTGMETVSSSNIPTKAGGETPRPMTKEEIMTTVKKYGEAAKRVQAIGFDAIEIHCGHSYLMSQFISPYYNKRTDEFGGSVGGGGRYDEMIGKFTGQNTPAVGFSIGFERIVMLLMERGYKVPTSKEKKAFLIEKNMPQEGMLKVLALAKKERENGRQVMIVNMKKNKKFQKEQLAEQGYTEITECYRDSVDSL